MAEDPKGKDQEQDPEKDQDGKDKQDPEKTPAELEIEKLKKELENEKLASAGKDKKLSQIEKEKKAKELEGLSAEERAKALESQIKTFEQKEAFRQSFVEVGLNPDDFQEIVNETDPKIQAKKFAELLKDQTAKSTEKALEDFKKEHLDLIDGEPKPKGKGEETPFMKGLAKGLQ